MRQVSIILRIVLIDSVVEALTETLADDVICGRYAVIPGEDVICGRYAVIPGEDVICGRYAVISGYHLICGRYAVMSGNDIIHVQEVDVVSEAYRAVVSLIGIPSCVQHCPDFGGMGFVVIASFWKLHFKILDNSEGPPREINLNIRAPSTHP